MVEVDVGGGIRGARVAFSCTCYQTAQMSGDSAMWLWEIRPADARSWEDIFGPDWGKVLYGTGTPKDGPLEGHDWKEDEAIADMNRRLDVLVDAANGENRYRWVVTADRCELEPTVEELPKKKRWRRPQSVRP